MPKFLFYAGTAFCLFLALTSAAEGARELQDGIAVFAGVSALPPFFTARAAWAIPVALIAGFAVAALLLRMATLLAARNLFGAFFSLVAVGSAMTSLAWLLLLQTRMLIVSRHGGDLRTLSEVHFVSYLVLGYFVSLAMVGLRPYFRIQASRVLSALVFFPLPLFALIVAQELFVTGSAAPLPAPSPASLVYFAVLAILFFSIALHCIRHRHLFLEMTNLRELMDTRIDPTRTTARPIRLGGGVAFDS